MAENVSTGGLMQFRYSKENKYLLPPEQKREIEEAYEDYHNRKEREKKKKNLWIVIILIILLAVLGFVLYRIYFM
ncbi:MAG: hypothetical protein AABY10_04320 [Nanoarchaeota archaeon]